MSNYAVYRTGHQIADTVAQNIAYGTDWPSYIPTYTGEETPVGYGILRGMAAVFKSAKQYIHLDRGYFKPGHFDGYYRVSCNGTQQTRFAPWMEDPARWEELGLEVKPWRGVDWSKPALVCPPTDEVDKFFGKPSWDPWWSALDTVTRYKGAHGEINFSDYSFVVTFNSSVGWQALMEGIPCISDPQYSLLGTYFLTSLSKKNDLTHKILIDSLSEHQYRERYKLFAIQANLQMTLSEMREGAICELVEKLVNLERETQLPKP